MYCTLESVWIVFCTSPGDCHYHYILHRSRSNRDDGRGNDARDAAGRGSKEGDAAGRGNDEQDTASRDASSKEDPESTELCCGRL